MKEKRSSGLSRNMFRTKDETLIPLACTVACTSFTAAHNTSFIVHDALCKKQTEDFLPFFFSLTQ
jgi:hypothetical protein